MHVWVLLCETKLSCPAHATASVCGPSSSKSHGMLAKIKTQYLTISTASGVLIFICRLRHTLALTNNSTQLESSDHRTTQQHGRYRISTRSIFTVNPTHEQQTRHFHRRELRRSNDCPSTEFCKRLKFALRERQSATETDSK